MKYGKGLKEVLAVKLFSGEIGGVELHSEAQFDAVSFIVKLLEEEGVTIYKEIIEELAEELQRHYYKLEYFDYSEAEETTSEMILNRVYQVDAEHGGNFKNTNKLITQSIIMDQLMNGEFEDIFVLVPTKDTYYSRLANNNEIKLMIDVEQDDEGNVVSYSYTQEELNSKNASSHNDKEVLSEKTALTSELVEKISVDITNKIYENSPFD